MIGSYLHDGRMQLGLTLRDLGGKVNLSAGFLSEVERGTRTPSMKTAIDIGRALGQSDGSIAYFWVATQCESDVFTALAETIRSAP